MAINFTQTDSDNAAVDTSTERAGCSGAIYSGLAASPECTDGGTAGTLGMSFRLAASAVGEAGLCLVCVPAAGTTWAAGTWTVRFNVTTANMNLTVTAVHICRANSSGTNQETIGSATGLSISLGTTGVKSQAVTGSAVTPAAGDLVTVVLVGDNGSMSAATASITRGQNIDSPFTGLNQYTLAAATGALTLTGNAANLEASHLLKADTGSFALTGNAAVLTKTIPLLAGTGVYNLTGNAANLEHGRLLKAETGVFSLTGNAATLRKNTPLVAGTGSFSLTGNAADLKHNRLAKADTGAFALTGNAAGLRANKLVFAATGAHAFTGNAATLTYSQGLNQYTLTAEKGSFTLTGGDAALRATHTLRAETGQFSLTGNAAGLFHSWLVTAEVGSFTFTGNDAGLRHDWLLKAEPGAFDLTGNAATLTYAPAPPAPAPVVSTPSAGGGGWTGQPREDRKRHRESVQRAVEAAYQKAVEPSRSKPVQQAQKRLRETVRSIKREYRLDPFVPYPVVDWTPIALEINRLARSVSRVLEAKAKQAQEAEQIRIEAMMAEIAEASRIEAEERDEEDAIMMIILQGAV